MTTPLHILAMKSSCSVPQLLHLTSIEVAEGRNHYPDNVCIPSTGVYISDQTSIEVAEGRNHYPDNVCIPSIGV